MARTEVTGLIEKKLNECQSYQIESTGLGDGLAKGAEEGAGIYFMWRYESGSH